MGVVLCGFDTVGFCAEITERQQIVYCMTTQGGISMKKRIASICLILTMLGSIVPVWAEDVNDELQALRYEEAMIEEDVEPTPPPLNFVREEMDSDPTQEPYENKPIVHTEEIPYDIDFSEEDEPQISDELIHPDRLLNPGGISTFALANTTDDLWRSMLTEQLGEDYLSPSSRQNGATVSGNTNRLSIEETDLMLPGKNGLDVVIKRRYDNQDYNDSLAYEKSSYWHDTTNTRYLYSFTNQSTNEAVNVAFLNPDDLYIHMYNGYKVKRLDITSRKSGLINDTAVYYYNFEDIAGWHSDTGTIELKYNPSITCRKLLVRYDGAAQIYLMSIKTIANENRLGNDWSLITPSLFLYRYDNDSYSDDKVSERYGELTGSFRDIDGKVYQLKGSDTFKEYKKNNTTLTYTSSFRSDDNNYLSFKVFYQPQTLASTGIKYHVVVYDRRGLTYYLYNIGITEGNIPTAKQECQIVAVTDQYNNMIQYQYDDKYAHLNKIIDTYGREINISDISGGKQISYYDDAAGETKAITYQTSMLSSSALNNDSMFKAKPVQRFTVTDAEGQKTMYDSRTGSTIAYYTGWTVGHLDDVVDLKKQDVLNYETHHIERIIYPTGAEARYKYKYILPRNGLTLTRRGLYAVEDAYNLVNGQKTNHVSYSIEGENQSKENMKMTVTKNDLEIGSTTISKYNTNSLLTSETTSANGTTWSSPYTQISYFYDDYFHPNKVSVDHNGILDITKYSYAQGYPDCLNSVMWENKKISYTYHTIDRSRTDIPKTISVQYGGGDNWTTDYMQTTTLTPDNKSVAMSKVTQNNVVKSQTAYSYDSAGNVISTKQWTQDTNGDGVLDDNDDVAVLNSPVTVTANKTASVTKYVDDITNIDGINEGQISDTYAFNLYGSPVSHTDSYGTTTTISYDAVNRPISYHFPNGSEQTIEYNLAQNYTIVTDAAGVKIKNIYDGLGRILKQQRYNGSSWDTVKEYTYDGAGRLDTETEYRSNTTGTKTSYTYNLLNQIIAKTVSELPSSRLYTENYSYGYDKTNRVMTVTTTTNAADGSEAAKVIDYYDYLGRKFKTERVSGNTTITTTAEYDYLDRCTKKTDANGNITQFEYDYAGNVVKQTNAVGDSVSNVYDMAGQLVQEIDAKGNSTYYAYDDLGRLLKKQTPFQGTNTGVTNYYYDKNSNILKDSTKIVGKRYDTNEYKYDIMGNKVADIKGGVVTQYQYDNANRLITTIAGLTEYSDNPTGGAVTQYEYDSKGNVSQITDPMGLTEKYTSYDFQGNLSKREDKNGRLIAYDYGTYGLTKISSVDFANIAEGKDFSEYDYDSLGRLVGTYALHNDEDWNMQMYNYDAFGRKTEHIADNEDWQKYTYDNNGNVLTHTLLVNGSEELNERCQYNELNQLTSLATGDTMTAYEYDKNGNLEYQISSRGTSIIYGYNEGNMLTSMEFQNGESRTYYCSYYANGLKRHDTDSNWERYYVYDYDTGRLKSISYWEDDSGFSYDQSYTYDNFGNRIRETISNNKVTLHEIYEYTYDLNNRMLSRTKSQTPSVYSSPTTPVEQTEYSYDNNGNTIAEQTTPLDDAAAEGQATEKLYTYDGLNRLIEYTDGETTASYRYDANNLRQTKTVNGLKTVYTWNGTNLVKEQGGSVFNTYHYDVTGLHSAVTNEAWWGYIKDPHGDVTAVLDMYGGTIANYEYDAFGNQLMGDTAPNPFGYCGEYLDNETGLIYLRNRYYNSATGRFLTEDPAKDGLNWYVYCANNPIMFVDPMGLAPFDHFKTADDAAIDFGLYIGQKSIDLEEEFASVIYADTDEDGNMYYYYDEPRNDLETHDERKISFTITPSFENPKAISHCHGAYDVETENTKDGFSSPDNVLSDVSEGSDTYNSDKSGLDFYVATPIGNLYKYISNSGDVQGTLIGTDMPVDKKYVDHKLQRWQNTLIWNLLRANFPKATTDDIIKAKLRAERNNPGDDPDSWVTALDELEKFR